VPSPGALGHGSGVGPAAQKSFCRPSFPRDRMSCNGSRVSIKKPRDGRHRLRLLALVKRRYWRPHAQALSEDLSTRLACCLIAGYFRFPGAKLKATAARIRVFNADASMSSPSLRSIARVDFASRPALNRCFGSFRNAPLKKLSFTWSLKAPALQTRPLFVHTAVPHFHSSVRSGAAARMILRRRASIWPRQSPSCAIRSVIRCEALGPAPLDGFVMCSPCFAARTRVRGIRRSPLPLPARGSEVPRVEDLANLRFAFPARPMFLVQLHEPG